MDAKEIMRFMSLAEKLKCETRHSWTSTSRPESVAEHCWRLCVFSWLLRDQLPELDMDKVMKMCLFHDLGEAISGDIPSFIKSRADEIKEDGSIDQILGMLSGGLKTEMEEMFAEMKELKTREARLYKALDKMEAVIQHNEAPIETWLELEYELNKTYANEEVKGVKILEEIREEIRKTTVKKILDREREMRGLA